MYSVEKSRVPQLRVLVTEKCRSKCIYCRPGGESFCNSHFSELTAEQIYKAVSKLSEYGLKAVKISGGEPILRKDIINIISLIKTIKTIEHIELITRDPNVINIIDELEDTGLDCLNFSLDTLDKNKWEVINGRKGFENLIDVIRKVGERKKLNIKVNSVMVMNSLREIEELIEFMSEIGGGTLKLLDLIDDITLDYESKRNFFRSLVSVEEVEDYLSNISISKSMTYAPGGLGHPMVTYKISEKVNVQLKSNKEGAYYNEKCTLCDNYQCHDAIMALRLTPYGFLQTCLLREDNMLNIRPYIFDNQNMSKEIYEIFEMYKSSKFYTYKNICNIKK